MNKFFKSRMIRSMIPYFILAVAVIVAFRITAEIGFFSEILGRFWAVIAPFLTGAVIAYILNIPCSGIRRLLEKTGNPFVVRKSHGLSVVSLVLLALILLGFILNLLIPAVSTSILLFIDQFPDYEQTVMGWIDSINEMDLPEFIPDFYISEDGIFTAIQDWLTSFEAGNIMDSVIAGFGGVMSSVFNMFLAIVSSIYLLVEKDRLRKFVMRFIEAATSDSTNSTILKYSRKLNFNFRRYIYVQTIDGVILGSIMTIVLLLFGSDFAIVLGLILGVLNYIPYFGSIIGTGFAVLVVAFTQGIPTAVVAAIVMFAIQQLDGNYIQPRLMGGSFSLSPLLVIISVTVGMAYGGILGMLVAIPIVAILKDMLDTYIEYLEKKKKDPPSSPDFMDRDIW